MLTSTEQLPKLENLLPELEGTALRTIIFATQPVPLRPTKPEKAEKDVTGKQNAKESAPSGASTTTPSASTSSTSTSSSETNSEQTPQLGVSFLTCYTIEQVRLMGERSVRTEGQGARPSSNKLALIMYTSGTTGITLLPFTFFPNTAKSYVYPQSTNPILFYKPSDTFQLPIL